MKSLQTMTTLTRRLAAIGALLVLSFSLVLAGEQAATRYCPAAGIWE
jgi:hypothetical protein